MGNAVNTGLKDTWDYIGRLTPGEFAPFKALADSADFSAVASETETPEALLRLQQDFRRLGVVIPDGDIANSHIKIAVGAITRRLCTLRGD